MKRILKVIVALGILSSFILTSCNNKNMEIDKGSLEDFEETNYNTEYYDNFQFNQYYNEEESQKYLPNQGMFGSANAYILRYNGMYYMYMGSSNMGNSSLPCWKSEDLMCWEQVDNGINLKGSIGDDPRFLNSYPPCVKQYNGTFYMYLYIKNDLITQGNYILTASSPEGPFEFLKDENNEPICYTIDETTLNIDCDIFIDDNEDIYFMSGHQDNYFTGIRAFKMPNMGEVSYDENSYINIGNSSIGGWTEGNGIFKRNGNYYLMYTGSNILSPGYLTHYSVAKGEEWKKAFGTEDKLSAPGFEQGIDWPMGCKTEDKFYSLGHATSILGPDMDGLYYHYFSVNSAGPNGTFAIDRLIFNGTQMDSAQTQFHSVKPKRPTIYSYSPLDDSKNFEKQNNSLLSKENTNNIFTIEFNYIGDTKCVFSYIDKDNYSYVKVDSKDNYIKLFNVENGKKEEIAKGKIVRDYDNQNAYKTIRVGYRDNKISVWFDDLLKIDNKELSLKKGKFGYIYSNEIKIGYTACSNVALGLSDSIEPKLSYINIGAESYLPIGIYENKGSNLSSKSYYVKVDENEYNGKYLGLGKMVLGKKGDSATYLVDFNEDRDGGNNGYYALQMTLNKKFANTKLGVRIDGGEMFIVEVPSITPTNNSDLIKTTINDLPIKKGVREITFICLDEKIEFHSFTFKESTSQHFLYETSLEKAPKEGMEQKSLWRFEKKLGDEKASLVSREGVRSLVYFGGNDLLNYTVECDFRINEDGIGTAGFIVNSSNYSNSPYYTEDYKYIQGYYIALNKRMSKIEKLNYTHSDGNAAARRVKLDVGKWHHIKIDVMGNSIVAEIRNADGEMERLEFVDDVVFGGGRFGFYSNGMSMSYSNLKIKG